MPRILASVCVTVFLAVFFAVPLYAAMTICTMPCCHPNAQPAMAASMSGCATECVVRTDDTTAAAARIVIPQSTMAFVAPMPLVVDAVEPRPSTPIESDTGPIHGDASLYILNSIFRI